MVAANDETMKLAAFVGLAFIQVSVAVIYKACQTQGGYTFSPSSAIAIAEFIKLGLSITFFSMNNRDLMSKGLAAPRLMFDKFAEHLDFMFCFQTSSLALLYTFNNQSTFYQFLVIDPAFITLVKATMPILAAFLNVAFFNRSMTQQQWMLIFVTFFGLVIVQFDPCKGAFTVPLFGALSICLSVCISALCSTWNEFLIKKFKVEVLTQNIVLYSAGTVFNTTAFVIFRSVGLSDKGFFEGYVGWSVMVLVANAFMGLAMTAVYVYADAVVKTLASTFTAGIVLFIGYFFYGGKMNVTILCGTAVVSLAIFMYFKSPPAPPEPEAKEPEMGAPAPFLTRNRLIFFGLVIFASAVYFSGILGR